MYAVGAAAIDAINNAAVCIATTYIRSVTLEHQRT